MTLIRRSETESKGGQPHDEIENTKEPSFNFWDQDFPITWSHDLGMDACTFHIIKMYEKKNLGIHNLNPETKAKVYENRMVQL